MFVEVNRGMQLRTLSNIMVILRNGGMFYTNDLYTSLPDGTKVFVSHGYSAPTRAEVIRLAYLNAAARNMLASLSRKMQVPPSGSVEIGVQCVC